jgi:ribosomal protein S27AE
MQQLSPEQRQKIVEIFKQKGVTLKCPMCGNSKFILIDGYFTNLLQGDLKYYTIGGTSIPTIAATCSNCGFISQHSLGILGLLDTPEINEY